MTVVIVLDSVKDEEVVDEVKRARSVILLNRRGVKNSPLFTELKKMLKKMEVPVREFTIPKLNKVEIEGLAVAIGRYYAASPKERIIFADKTLIIH